MYATTRCLPLHELVEDLTWIGFPKSRDAPPLRYALHRGVLDTDDVVESLEYPVDQNLELLSSRDRDGLLPLHVACRHGISFKIVQSLVNLHKASVKTVTPQGDLPLFLACEMPETSLDTRYFVKDFLEPYVYAVVRNLSYVYYHGKRCRDCVHRGLRYLQSQWYHNGTGEVESSSTCRSKLKIRNRLPSTRQPQRTPRRSPWESLEMWFYASLTSWQLCPWMRSSCSPRLIYGMASGA
jgi:hypothetical protein